MINKLFFRRWKNRILNTDYKCIWEEYISFYLEYRIWDHVKDFCNIRRHISNTKHSIKKLIYWFPIIWGDCDWDYYFFMKILLHKIKSMETFFYSDKTHIMDAEKYAREIKQVRILLERYLNDNYLTKELEKPEEKWGEREFCFKPTENKDLYDVLMYYPKAKDKEEEKIADEEYYKAGNIAEQKKDEDFHKIFNLFKRNLRGWWD